MAKKKKSKYIDDGHTIYNMDVEGFKWHDKKVKNESNLTLDKKEKFLLHKAAFRAYFPILLIVLIGFALAGLLIYFWLK